jgi:4-amino-4-deoxy-L-arabinose transferase-like glycosyltransferase
MKKKIEFTKENLSLSLIVILSAILNFANISIDGYGNQYYAAGVRSMTMSLKNFFFVSFDPSSFVTIDKPPLGFWIQAISAKIFGYSGWSILLPQALAGVISVVVIYHIVKRPFGSPAGLISALCLAVTPVFVAVSRNNTCDNLLVLTLLLACLAISKAAEKGKIKYLLISLALVGVGFNIKMLQAYMVVPAIYLTYLLSNAISLKKRIIHLTLASVVLLLVSFSWAFAVDLVPAANRPYVGSSTNNTEMELIIGHNGLERLGLSSSSTSGGGPGGGGQKPTQSKNDSGQMQAPPSQQGQNSSSTKQGTEQSKSQGTSQEGMTPPSGGNGQGGPGGNGSKGGGGGTFGGSEKSSITRLFSNNSLSDQISWFLPLAMLGFVAAAIKEKLKNSFDNKRKLSLILWFTWLVPEFVYFSFTTGLFHPYYLTMLAAPIAALTGIGIVSMWQLYKEGGWKSWILPISLILDGLAQMLLLYYYNTLNVAKIIMIVLSVLCFISSVVLIILNLTKNKNIKLKKVVLTLALVGLLVAPTVCSSTTIFYGMSGTFPSAGLSLTSQKGMGGQSMGSSNSSNTKLIEFLKSNKTNEKYILVTSSTTGYASDIIVETGESVMALGGFFGTDKVITLAQFKQLVSKGEVRYIMVGGMGGGNSSNDIMTWVKSNGKVVSESEWKNSSTTNKQTANKNSDSNSKNSGNQGPGEMNSEQLYDLKGSVK